VYAIAPPMQIACTRARRFSTTAILSETLAPPITATNGDSGAFNIRDSTSTSRASSSPAARSRKCDTIPAVDACARCAAPKASST